MGAGSILWVPETLLSEICVRREVTKVTVGEREGERRRWDRRQTGVEVVLIRGFTGAAEALGRGVWGLRLGRADHWPRHATQSRHDCTDRNILPNAVPRAEWRPMGETILVISTAVSHCCVLLHFRFCRLYNSSLPNITWKRFLCVWKLKINYSERFVTVAV